MQANEQGVREPGRQRYQAIPRTLLLITSPSSDPKEQRDVLLLKGAPDVLVFD